MHLPGAGAARNDGAAASAAAEVLPCIHAVLGGTAMNEPTYDTRTSSDRIDELNRQMTALRAEFRALSEQYQVQASERNPHKSRLVQKIMDKLQEEA
jgi:ribosomal protein L29